jgi:hypothetical protein
MKGEFTKRSAVCLTLVGAIMFAITGCLPLLTGCKNKSKNQREVGFRWGTEITFFDRVSKTSGADVNDAYESEIEAPALVEWILPGPPAEGQVTPAMSVADGKSAVQMRRVPDGGTQFSTCPFVLMCWNGTLHQVQIQNVPDMEAKGAVVGECPAPVPPQ